MNTDLLSNKFNRHEEAPLLRESAIQSRQRKSAKRASEVVLSHRYPLIREGMKRILEASPAFIVAGESNSARDLKKQIECHHPDILILDLKLGEGSGLELLEDIKRKFPNLAIITIGLSVEDKNALRAIRLGALSFLCKNCCPKDFLKAVKAAARGEFYFTAKVAQAVAKGLNTSSSDVDPCTLLSNRELEIMFRLGKGVALTEIAKKLSISVKTISSYRSRIFKKMGFKNNAELVRYIIRNNLD